MTPEGVAELLEKLAPYMTQCTEVQLADFGETAAGGPFAKFRYPEPDEIAIFRGKDRVTRTKQGTRYTLMLVELQDDDRPVNHEQRQRVEHAHEQHDQRQKGGALSRVAALFCQADAFLKWLDNTFPLDCGEYDEKTARDKICHDCGIASRAELDHNPKAERIFHTRFRVPYLRAQGWDA